MKQCTPPGCNNNDFYGNSSTLAHGVQFIQCTSCPQV